MKTTWSNNETLQKLIEMDLSDGQGFCYKSGCVYIFNLVKYKEPCKIIFKNSFRVQILLERKWRQTLSFSIFLFYQKSISQIKRKEIWEIKARSPRVFHTVTPGVLTLQPLNINSTPVNY